MNKDCWQTPLELFKQLDDKYNFEVDVCASQENALCECFWAVDDDCLQQDWGEGKGFVWCNPPYSNPLPFVEKCQQYGYAVMLLNQDTSTKWAKIVFEKASNVILLSDRVRFINPVTLEVGKSNPKCQMIVVFDKSSNSGVDIRWCPIKEIHKHI
ncbi:TPA: phage N-6-adenine-methyltransferase [Escherichia coli]|nr:phage N-6-adenine-methyltransferase [Escherichia coli]